MGSSPQVLDWKSAYILHKILHALLEYKQKF